MTQTQVQYTVEPQGRPLAVMVSIATLEQLVAALNNAEDALNNSQALIAGRERLGFAKPCYGANEIALGFVSPAITAGRAALANAEPAAKPETKLWLWKNFVDGRQEYWAFDNLYPINMTDGDPQTLGEPCGYALFKPSRNGRKDAP